MLQTLEQLGKQVGSNLARTWDSLAEGWRELWTRSANALTRFTRKANGTNAASGELVPADAPRWSLLAGDVVDTGKEIVVRVEVPGVEKSDCEVLVRDDALYVRGEKRADVTYVDGDYHVRQCAYGAFERTVPLPCRVQADRSDAQLKNGVLTVRLPKASGGERKRLRIS